MAEHVTENPVCTFSYLLGKHQLRYEDGWLTLSKGNLYRRVLIDPIGLIENGLHLCNLASNREHIYEGYSHIGSVFPIGAEAGYFHFSEGSNVTALIKISNGKLLDLGLTLIELGNKLSAANSIAEEIGVHVTIASVEE